MKLNDENTEAVVLAPKQDPTISEKPDVRHLPALVWTSVALVVDVLIALNAFGSLNLLACLFAFACFIVAKILIHRQGRSGLAPDAFHCLSKTLSTVALVATIILTVLNAIAALTISLVGGTIGVAVLICLCLLALAVVMCGIIGGGLVIVPVGLGVILSAIEWLPQLVTDLLMYLQTHYPEFIDFLVEIGLVYYY